MKTQVLIVDDSEVYRLFLRNTLAAEPELEVVSVASNGRLALPRVNHYKPEIILLDYDMPEMDCDTRDKKTLAAKPHHHVQHAHHKRCAADPAGARTGRR